MIADREPPCPDLFAGLEPDLRAAFVRAAKLRSVAAGEVVLEYGAPVRDLFVVESGTLHAEILDRHGLPMEVARFGRGDYFGEMAFLRGDAASARVRAVGDAEVWAVPHAVLGWIADRSPSVMRALAVVLARRLSDTDRRLRQLRPGILAVCSAEAGSCAALATAAARSAARQSGRPVILVTAIGPGEQRHIEALPSLAELLDSSSALTVVERFGEGLAPALGVIRASAAELDRARSSGFVQELRRRCELLVVLGPAPEPGVLDGFDDADVRFAIVPEAAPGPSATTPMVLVRERGPLAPAEVHGPQGAGGGLPILRLVNGTAADFEAAVHGQTNEPALSIGWLGRHLIRRKVGLALGAGGSKGYAHLGAVAELREAGVPFDFVAGSSIGAPIAAAVASGFETARIKRMLDRTFSRATVPTFPFHSIFTSRVLRRDMEEYCRGLSFETMTTPLAIVAVDLHRRVEVVFRRGDLARAIVASMAIPGLFRPVRAGGHLLVDGGLLNPVPIATVAAAGADVVIGIKLTSGANADVEPANWRRPRLRLPPIVDNIQNAFEVMQWRIMTDGAARADISIEPQFTGSTGLRDHGRGAEFVEAGRLAARAAMPAIREALPWTGRR